MDSRSQLPKVSGVSEWRIILPLCLTVFAVLVHGSLVGPLAVEMADDLDTSVALIGQVSTVIFVMMGLVGLLVGPLADHFGYRRTILIGLLILMASTVVSSLAPNYEMLLVGALIAGVGAATWGVNFGVAAARFTGDAQRRAISRVQASQTTGTILGALILTAIAAATSWRGAYGFVLTGYALATVLVFRGLTADSSLDPGRFSAQTMLTAYRPLLRDRGMVTLFTASAMRAIGWFGPLVYIGAFYADEHGLSLRQIGVAYTLGSIGILFGNLAAGEWFGKFDLRRVFGVSTSLLATVWLIVFLLPLSATATVAVMMVAAFNAGVGWISLTTLLARETPGGAGTTMTLNGSIFALGSAASAAIGGVLISVGGYALLGVVFPLFTLVAALLVWRPGFALTSATERTTPT